MAPKCAVGLFQYDSQEMIRNWNSARKTIARKAADIISGKYKNITDKEVIHSYLPDKPQPASDLNKKEVIEINKSKAGKSMTQLFIKVKGK